MQKLTNIYALKNVDIDVKINVKTNKLKSNLFSSLSRGRSMFLKQVINLFSKKILTSLFVLFITSIVSNKAQAQFGVQANANLNANLNIGGVANPFAMSQYSHNYAGTMFQANQACAYPASPVREKQYNPVTKTLNSLNQKEIDLERQIRNLEDSMSDAKDDISGYVGANIANALDLTLAHKRSCCTVEPMDVPGSFSNGLVKYKDAMELFKNIALLSDDDFLNETRDFVTEANEAFASLDQKINIVDDLRIEHMAHYPFVYNDKIIDGVRVSDEPDMSADMETDLSKMRSSRGIASASVSFSSDDNHSDNNEIINNVGKINLNQESKIFLSKLFPKYLQDNLKGYELNSLNTNLVVLTNPNLSLTNKPSRGIASEDGGSISSGNRMPSQTEAVTSNTSFKDKLNYLETSRTNGFILDASSVENKFILTKGDALREIIFDDYEIKLIKSSRHSDLKGSNVARAIFSTLSSGNYTANANLQTIVHSNNSNTSSSTTANGSNSSELPSTVGTMVNGAAGLNSSSSIQAQSIAVQPVNPGALNSEEIISQFNQAIRNDAITTISIKFKKVSNLVKEKGLSVIDDEFQNPKIPATQLTEASRDFYDYRVFTFKDDLGKLGKVSFSKLEYALLSEHFSGDDLAKYFLEYNSDKSEEIPITNIDTDAECPGPPFNCGFSELQPVSTTPTPATPVAEEQPVNEDAYKDRQLCTQDNDLRNPDWLKACKAFGDAGGYAKLRNKKYKGTAKLADTLCFSLAGDNKSDCIKDVNDYADQVLKYENSWLALVDVRKSIDKLDGLSNDEFLADQELMEAHCPDGSCYNEHEIDWLPVGISAFRAAVGGLLNYSIADAYGKHEANKVRDVNESLFNRGYAPNYYGDGSNTYNPNGYMGAALAGYNSGAYGCAGGNSGASPFGSMCQDGVLCNPYLNNQAWAASNFPSPHAAQMNPMAFSINPFSNPFSAYINQAAMPNASFNAGLNFGVGGNGVQANYNFMALINAAIKGGYYNNPSYQNSNRQNLQTPTGTTIRSGRVIGADPNDANSGATGRSGGG